MQKTNSILKLFLALLAGMALLVLTNGLLGGITYAAGTITVTTADDENNDDGDCSLREAIRAANLDIVVDACASGSEADTIQFNLPVSPTIITLTDQLEIRNDPLTIDGPGAELLAISGNDAVRVFDVTSNVAVTLTGITVQHGQTFGDGAGLKSIGPLTLIDTAFVNNTAGDDGGAIDIKNRVTISNSLILSNTASGDGGAINIHTSQAFGLDESQFEKSRDAYLSAGLSNDDISTALAGSIDIMAENTLTAAIHGGRFENNWGGAYGGALYINGALILTQTQFISNSAVSYGGAAFSWGYAQISEADFISNTAGQQAGGVWAQSGGALVDATFRGNAAQTGQAGGLYVNGSVGLTRSYFFDNQAGDRAGGLIHLGQDARIVNTLFARNSAPDEGGAMFLASTGNALLLHNTIAAPSAPVPSAVAISGTGSISAVNNIFDGYTTSLEVIAGAVYEDYNLFNKTAPVTGSLTRGGHSLSGAPNFVNPASDDYHLSAGSWALNTGLVTTINADIDSDPRPGGSAIDIGFDETTHTTDAGIAKRVEVTPAAGAPLTYTIIFSNAGGSMLDGIVITDVVPALVEQITVISSGALITNASVISNFVWQVAPLSPGQTGIITISGRLTEALPRGVFTNTVKLTVSRPLEPDPANNTDAVGVTVPNFAPVANADIFTTPEDTTVILHPVANDTDGDPLVIDTFDQPGFGAASLSGTTSLIYTPTLNFNGTDVLTYVVNDTPLTDTAVISVVVTPVNDAPVIADDVITVTMSEDGSPTPFALVATAGDVDNDPLSWSVSVSPQHGAAAVTTGLAVSTTVAFTPTHNYYGDDSFFILVSDGTLTDTVIVSLTIEAVNDAPVAADDTTLILNKKESSDMLPLSIGPFVTLSVLHNDTDVDSGSLSVGQVGTPNHGGQAGTAAGGSVLVYTPTATFSGVEIFTYTVTDGYLVDTAVVTATVLDGVNGGNNGDTFSVLHSGDCGVMTITVEIPAGIAGGKKFALIYDEPTGAETLLPDDLLPVCNLFNLTAILDGLSLNDFTFDLPLTITIDYGDTDVATIGGPIEQSLNLYYWDGNGWSTAGISVIEQDTTAHWIKLTLAHASKFHVFRQGPIYLPLVMKNFTPTPDLVVQSLIATTDTVQVIIANTGVGSVNDEFWVDVYLNPNAPPTGVNQIWQDRGSQGLVWGVTAGALPLAPGQTLTLTVDSAYYRPDKSVVVWPLSAGLPVYAQVDSVDRNTTHGAVLEYHEIVQQPYNNIAAATSGPGAVGIVIMDSASSDTRIVTSGRLPER